jgi:tetratricopeptide (TPR) repeat protein
VNLGSLDGLAKGVDLPVVRDRQIGRMVITTVFRDRARGKIVSGEAIGANDSVRVPSSAHLNAILQQVDALAASDDLKAARDLAQKALTGGKPGETRQLLERLAALDYRAGAADAARERYEVAVNNFDQAPAAGSAERATALNSLGSLLLMRGDLPRAEETLQRALAKADADPSLTTEILNNLGAAAEARGDLTKAREYYGRALTGKPSDIVRTNLARVNSAKHP